MPGFWMRLERRGHGECSCDVLNIQGFVVSFLVVVLHCVVGGSMALVLWS